MFSALAWDSNATMNQLSIERELIEIQNDDIIDLVKGNVTEHGISYPTEILQDILQEAVKKTAMYKPDSLGQKEAREAVSHFYRMEGVEISAQNILLTPGTSVSFSYLFGLLADPGDEILCPCPSYPLFDTIAKLCGVRLVPYPLDESQHWEINLEKLERSISRRTRAIVVISPHNPTGSVASEQELEIIAEIARRHKLPIIADEVFSQFLFGTTVYPRASATKAPLVFTLNGFSKTFALPGLKLGWVAVSGDASFVTHAISALEQIADTFLSVSEITQFAAPRIIEMGSQFRRDYIERIARWRNCAVEQLTGLRIVSPSGGFYLTIPIGSDEDEASIELLKKHRILVHPGYFYDIEGNHLVTTVIHSKCQEAFATLGQFVRGL